MKFKTGDKVKLKEKIGIIMRRDTEYMEPYYGIQFPDEKYLDWAPESQLSLYCETCGGTGLVVDFRHHVKCEDCNF